MVSREGYDVLRFIEHNRVCYVSSEYVKGSPMIRWLKYHPQIAKEVLFAWMHDMIRQLGQFHKCRGHPCYQYVNPYSIIVTEEGVLYFLDMGSSANEEELKRMQRRTVREHFLPAGEAYYQKASVALDIYGLGKTFQYLLSESDPEPRLSSREIIRLQKTISKCLNEHSKKSFQKVSDIHKYIPQYKQGKERNFRQKKILLPGVVTAVILIGISGFLKDTEADKETEKQKKTLTQEGQVSGEKKSGQEREVSGEDHKELSEEDQYKMELGVLYFLKIKDYEKSRLYFQSVGNCRLAEDLSVISERLAGGRVEEEQLRDVLKDAGKQLDGMEDAPYYQCLIRGYACLESEEDMRVLADLGERYLEFGLTEDLSETIGCIAVAYEKCGQTESAINMYELQLQQAEEAAVRTEIYKKLPVLFCEKDRPEQAQEILRRGIEEFPESAELRILYIKVQCQDAKIDREVCRKTIEESVRDVPVITKEEEFQKLMQECGFETEGGNVWIKQ